MSTTEPDLEQPTKKAGRPRSAQSHQAIITATLELLAEEGFQGMSIEAVAERAGVGKTTIYRRWGSKEDLAIDAFKSIQITQDIIDTGNIRDDLLSILNIGFQANVDFPLLGKLLFKILAESKSTPEVFQVFYMRLVAPRFEGARQMIQRAQARGELRTDIGSELILSLFAGPFYFMLLSSFIGLNSATPNINQIVDAILSGIAAHPSA